MLQKPNSLVVDFNDIPTELKKIPRWVLWKYTLVGEGDSQRWSKLPMKPNGSSASSTKVDTWVDFFTAQEAYEKGKFDGVGFVFTGDDDIVGIDIDDCRDENGVLNQLANDIISNVKGYVEVSPSGTGIKIFTIADLKHAHVDHAIGLEIYPKSRYFTVTGNYLCGEMPTEPQDLTTHVPVRTINRSDDEFASYNAPLEEWDLARVENELLSQLDPNNGYQDWLTVGMALHHQFKGDDDALAVWDRWSYNDGAVKDYATTGAYSCNYKWSTFKGSGSTIRTLIFKVNQKKLQQALDAGEVVLDANNPLDHARQFLNAQYITEEGYKLVHYSVDFFVYVGTHYTFLEEASVRAQLYKFLDKCKKQDKKGNLVPFNATPTTVNAALDAIKALTHLANDPNTKPPVWLEGYVKNNPPAHKLISLHNGLFHVEQSMLLPHSLGFFTYNSLPFAYDPQAQAPEWMKFLNDVWGEDEESKQLLQEYFGYILSGDNKQQKFLNVIGPRRSGKGTINRVLTDLLGQHNVVSPQMDDMCDNFALQSWIGKPLASFTDARVTPRNSPSIVSQFLRIVGGDTITVNRKNKEAWSGYLPTRIIVYSNEVLQLAENSNALTGRMMVLQMTNSFYGKEDVELADRLIKELAGIFNWAIEGQKRRSARMGERFIQPASSLDTLELMTELSNPMNSFMEEALEFDPLAEANKDDVFACYKHWALKKNLNPGTEISFKRRFLASTQEFRVSPHRNRTIDGINHVYRGVKLNDKAQAYVLTISNFEKEIF